MRASRRSVGMALLGCVAAAAATPGIYVVLLRRSRFDDLPTGLFNIRGRVIGKLRDQMRADLDRERAAAEALGK